MDLVYLCSEPSTYTSGTCKSNVRGSDDCREKNRLWIRILHRNTMAGLRECVVSTIAGPPPETTQAEHKGYRPSTRTEFKLKLLTPTGLEGWDSTDHDTATNLQFDSTKILQFSIPPLHVISCSHSFLSCHPSLHSWFEK